MSQGKQVAILVLGMHRSGTSALAGMLGHLGVGLGGRLKPAAPDNPKGFWELEPVVEVHECLLNGLGRSWDDVRPLPEGWLDSEAADRAIRALDLLLETEFRNESLWAVKDPRLCRLLPLWRRLLDRRGVEARVLLVRRSAKEVAASLEQRNGIPAELGRLLWARYVVDAVLGSRDMSRCMVDYAELLQDWAAVASRIGRELDVELRITDEARSRVEGFLAPSLRHNVWPEEIASTDAVARLYQAMGAASRGDVAEVEAAARAFDRDAAFWLPVAEGFSTLLAEHHARASLQLTQLQAVQAALDEATRWGAQKDHELLDALAQLGSLRAELTASSRWAEAKDQELVQARGRLESLQEELAAAGRWGETKDRELIDALERLEVMRGQLKESMEWAASREDELGRAIVRLGHLEGDVATLKRALDEKQSEVDELTGPLQTELERLSTHVQTLADERDARDAELSLSLQAKQQEVYALQNRTDELTSRLDALERRMQDNRIGNRVRGWAARVLLRGKIAAKRSIIAVVRALPGDDATRQARMDGLRRLRETVRFGNNGRAVLHDLHALAEHRWPARPAFLMRAQSTEPLPAIDVSVVLYENPQWIPRFVESLLGIDYPLDRVRIHLRDHSDSTRVADALVAFEPQLRASFATYRYSRGRNAGFGAGHNHNFAQSDAPIFLVTNVDGRFQGDAFRRLAQAVLKSVPGVAAWELRQVPYEHPKYYDPVTMLTTWVSGACVAFRRDAFRKVRGFDDAIFMYGEDVDLSYRLRAAGYALAYVPHAVFHHDSYTEPAQFKPLQFHGSTLANALLRLRFGTWADIAAIPFLWKQLAATARELGETRNYRRSLVRLLRKAPRFILTRPRAPGLRVPFLGWDYGLRRDGAFETIQLPVRSPRVSIIVRTYRGREALLHQALASIANQTYENLDVVVVEDKAATMDAFVRDCAAELGLHVRYLACSEASSNRCRTGNLGLDAATGTFCNFLDDDDLLFADHVEYLVAAFEKAPDAAACYALAWEAKTIHDPAHPGRMLEVMHSSLPGHRREFDREVLSQFNYMPIQAVLFRRSVFERYGGFDPRLENLEDWELWRRYSLHADFRYCAKTTSLYHIPADLEVQAGRQALLDDYYALAQRIGDEARDRFLSPEGKA